MRSGRDAAQLRRPRPDALRRAHFEADQVRRDDGDAAAIGLAPEHDSTGVDLVMHAFAGVLARAEAPLPRADGRRDAHAGSAGAQGGSCHGGVEHRDDPIY